MVFTLLAAFICNKSMFSILEASHYDDKTVYKYFKYFKNICYYKNKTFNIILGGSNKEVEIDKTHPFTRKLKRRKMLSYKFLGVWNFRT